MGTAMPHMAATAVTAIEPSGEQPSEIGRRDMKSGGARTGGAAPEFIIPVFISVLARPEYLGKANSIASSRPD